MMLVEINTELFEVLLSPFSSQSQSLVYLQRVGL